MKFVRSEDMMNNMIMDSFGGNVEQDLKVVIIRSRGKLKAYSPKLECYLQFPRKLRAINLTFVCDATESQNNGRKFYRAYKGTIRDEDNNVVG